MFILIDHVGKTMPRTTHILMVDTTYVNNGDLQDGLFLQPQIKSVAAMATH